VALLVSFRLESGERHPWIPKRFQSEQTAWEVRVAQQQVELQVVLAAEALQALEVLPQEQQQQEEREQEEQQVQEEEVVVELALLQQH